MKVVLFCGGLGMRLRDYSQNTPKPLVPIGPRPILWHLMSYYAAYGFKDFILCLGYRAESIKRYFLKYNECLSNNFVYENGGSRIELLSRDIHDWKITFVDTGMHTNIGGRLMAVRDYLKGEEVFLANYSDGLSNVPLDKYLEYFYDRDKIGMFLSVRAPHVFHVVDVGADNIVRDISHVNHSGLRINGGFFLFKKAIFDYMQSGEELVEEPFGRLIGVNQLIGYPHDGFWASMDTFKDRQLLNDLYSKGEAPWAIWEKKD
jgi:glucose-1-phosphate cytidylyltransferase